jgi:hypothetical protein
MTDPATHGILNMFHGRLDALTKSQILKAFTLGVIRCLVATTAFGLGVNVDNVRRIVHYGPPDNASQYWQEVNFILDRSRLRYVYYALLDRTLQSRWTTWTSNSTDNHPTPPSQKFRPCISWHAVEKGVSTTISP